MIVVKADKRATEARQQGKMREAVTGSCSFAFLRSSALETNPSAAPINKRH